MRKKSGSGRGNEMQRCWWSMKGEEKRWRRLTTVDRGASAK
jgi:hypothetical protein